MWWREVGKVRNECREGGDRETAGGRHARCGILMVVINMPDSQDEATGRYVPRQLSGVHPQRPWSAFVEGPKINDQGGVDDGPWSLGVVD